MPEAAIRCESPASSPPPERPSFHMRLAVRTERYCERIVELAEESKRLMAIQPPLCSREELAHLTALIKAFSQSCIEAESVAAGSPNREIGPALHTAYRALQALDIGLAELRARERWRELEADSEADADGEQEPPMERKDEQITAGITAKKAQRKGKSTVKKPVPKPERAVKTLRRKAVNGKVKGRATVKKGHARTNRHAKARKTRPPVIRSPKKAVDVQAPSKRAVKTRSAAAVLRGIVEASTPKSRRGRKTE